MEFGIRWVISYQCMELFRACTTRLLRCLTEKGWPLFTLWTVYSGFFHMDRLKTIKRRILDICYCCFCFYSLKLDGLQSVNIPSLWKFLDLVGAFQKLFFLAVTVIWLSDHSHLGSCYRTWLFQSFLWYRQLLVWMKTRHGHLREDEHALAVWQGVSYWLQLACNSPSLKKMVLIFMSIYMSI